MRPEIVEAVRTKPLRVRIDGGAAGDLQAAAARYALQTLTVTACLPVTFVDHGEADIVYGREPRLLAPGGVFIRRRPVPASPFDSAKVAWDGDYASLYFDGVRPQAPFHADGRLHVDADVVLATFLLLTGALEQGAAVDRHGCHLLRDLPLYRLGLLHHAPVNHYADILKSAFSENRTSREPHYVAALSHDVDYPEMVRSIELVRLIVQRGRRITRRETIDVLTGRSHFWKFGEWMEMERTFGFRSAFYFCGYGGSLPGYALRAPDPFYDVGARRFRELMPRMVADGFEIGLHASYNSWRDVNMMKREIERIERSSGRRVLGNRHHYWHTGDGPVWRTARLHAEAGLLYDASAGLERRIGFRHGICTPFRYYDFERARASDVLQLPSCLMDSQFFTYRDLSFFDDPWAEVEMVLRELRRFGGLFLANFHNRVLNGTFFPGWKEAAMRLYETFAEDGACQVMLPQEHARQWLDREKLLRPSGVAEGMS